MDVAKVEMVVQQRIRLVKVVTEIRISWVVVRNISLRDLLSLR
jgi:hypothetical protein